MANDTGLSFLREALPSGGVPVFAFDNSYARLPERFYAWSSVIVNGQVVATDYAPDVGWLDRSPDAKTLPKPGGPYVLHDLRDPDRGPFPQVSMTIPDGWILHRWAELTRGKKTAVRFEVIDSPGNPCTDRIKPFRGHGFDDLVRYFKALPNIDISEMRYDTVDGYRAAYVEYRPKGLVECGPDPAGPIPLEDGYNETWILDVDGVPLAIAASYGSAPTESIRSEVRQIVESIHIER